MILLRDVGLSFSIQAAWYALLRTYAPIRNDPKRVAWVHTLATAWLAGPVSLWYMYSYVWHWNEAANFTEDTTSRFIITYFLCFLVSDLISAHFHYKDQMGFVEGWFHHSAYITFFGWLCHSGYSVGIMTTMPLEVPTMILSLGRVFPQYRQDLAFGLSFFVFRIVYHSWLTYHWYHMKAPPALIWPYPVFILCLHLYWFQGWVKGQRKRWLANGEEPKTA